MTDPSDRLARLDPFAGLETRTLLETLGRVISRTRPEIGFAIVAIEPYPPVGPSGTAQVSSNMPPPDLSDALAVIYHKLAAGDLGGPPERPH